jgi:hypothetical protein
MGYYLITKQEEIDLLRIGSSLVCIRDYCGSKVFTKGLAYKIVKIDRCYITGIVVSLSLISNLNTYYTFNACLVTPNGSYDDFWYVFTSLEKYRVSKIENMLADN